MQLQLAAMQMATAVQTVHRHVVWGGFLAVVAIVSALGMAMLVDQLAQCLQFCQLSTVSMFASWQTPGFELQPSAVCGLWCCEPRDGPNLPAQLGPTYIGVVLCQASSRRVCPRLAVATL